MTPSAARENDSWERLDWVENSADTFDVEIRRPTRTLRQHLRLVELGVQDWREVSHHIGNRIELEHIDVQQAEVSAAAADADQPEAPIRAVLASVGGVVLLVIGLIGLFLIAAGMRSIASIVVCYLIPIGLWTTYLGLKMTKLSHASA
jgi:hypothetical protein